MSAIKFRGVSSTSFGSIDNAIGHSSASALLLSSTSRRRNPRSALTVREKQIDRPRLFSARHPNEWKGHFLRKFFFSRSQQYVVAGASHCSHCKKRGGSSYRDRDNGEIVGRNRESYFLISSQCSSYIPFLKSLKRKRVKFILPSRIAQKFTRGVPRLADFFSRKSLHLAPSML